MTQFSDGDPRYLRERQYHNSVSLTKRMNIHAEFSVNPDRWHRWIFGQLDLRSGFKVLELGSGSGALWLENKDRIPAGVQLVISDFSEGMLRETESRLREHRIGEQFEVIDAQEIPFSDCSFDRIVANHMLYHVTDRARALSEAHRVLKVGGRAIFATNGRFHLQELHTLLELLVPEAPRLDNSEKFGLETGLGQVRSVFKNVECRRYPDALWVTDAGAVEAYVESLPVGEIIGPEGLKRVRNVIEDVIERTGGLYVRKDAGVLLCSRT